MRLGIASGLDLQHHFHVFMNPPSAVDIVTTQNLLADAASAAIASETTTQTDAQGLLDYAQAIIQGEELMFIMDVPAAPAQQTPIVLVQADTSGAGTTPQPDYILKSCKETESIGDSRSAMHAVSPAGMFAVYLERYKGAQFIDLAEIKNITLLEGSKHGELVSQTSRGLVGYWYDPEPEYVGNDRAVFMAEYQGVRYKIVVDLHVFTTVMENLPSSCPPSKLIKVNKPASGNSGYDLNSITVTFAALEGGAVGLTNASDITLSNRGQQ
jgi:hypothetical protein